MNIRQFRRCLNCGAKSHRQYWKDDKCPVCEIVSSFIESTHGGLSQLQIDLTHLSTEYMTQKIEGGLRSKER